MSEHADGYDLEALRIACRSLPLEERGRELSRLRGIEMEREKIPLLAELRARLENPSPAHTAQVCEWGGLPKRTMPGIHTLQTGGNELELQFARRHFQEWKAGLHPASGRGLYFFGKKPGTGKTTLLTALAFDLLHWGGEHRHPQWQGEPLLHLFPRPTVQFWPLLTLIKHMKLSFNDRENRYDALELEQCDVLILDDLGKLPPTGWNMAEIFELVANRDAQMKPTWFSSNYSVQEIGARYALALGEQYHNDVDALTDRIAGNCEQVEFTGASWRLG